MIFIDRMVRCSQVAEEVRFGGFRIPSLLIEDDVVLLSSLNSEFQLSMGRFSDECEMGMRKKWSGD